MNSKTDDMEIDDTDPTVTICRLCAEMAPSKSFIPLYTDDKLEQTVAKQINQLVNDLVSPNDGLPQDVCLNCAENVGKFYAFVTNIIETQNKLRRIMQLPEIKKMGSSEEQQISLLNTDHTSPNALTHEENGPEIIANKDSNIRLNGKNKISLNKESITSPKKSLGNVNANRVVSNNVPPASNSFIATGSSAFSTQRPPGVDRPIHYLRLYRCGTCDIKFKVKEECLRHIARHHPGLKKQVSKNTIFEKISPSSNISPESQNITLENDERPESIKTTQNSQQSIERASTSSSPKPTTPSVTSTTKPSVPQPSAKSQPVAESQPASSSATKGVKTPPKPINQSGGRRRKVLAIDGFLREMQKPATRWICDVCGRAMASKFAFVRHLREHDWSDEEEENVKKKEQKGKLGKQNESVKEVVPKPVVGFCQFCKTRVANSIRHKMYHEITNLEEAHPNIVKRLEAASEEDMVFKAKNGLLSMQNMSSSENNASAVFTDVDDFVELLVVDPEMVEVNMQDILKRDGLIMDDRNRTVVVSSADEAIICVKDENFKRENVLIEEESTAETNETVFLENYEIGDSIIELPDQRVKWLSDADSAILFTCSICEQTFDSEKSFQNHYCTTEDIAKLEKEEFQEYIVDNEMSEQSLRIREYYCNVCNRSYKSPLVFRLHAAQHKNTSTVCIVCNSYFPDNDTLSNHINEKHPNKNLQLVEIDDDFASSQEKQCDVCGKITDNLKQHKMYHTIKELEYCKERNKKFLKKWFFCHKCNKKIFSEANFLFHMAKHEGSDTVNCRQCDFVAANIQDYNMHITAHTGGKYFICNDCDKCFFTRSAISDHVLIHMEGTRYMCEICGKRFKTSRSNAQHKLLQHKKYFRCNRCNRGFTHEAKLNSHYNICQVINQEQNDSKVFEPVERFFCNICNSNIKSSSEISILFHKAKHEGKDGVECRFCNFLCKNACIYKNHLLIHTNQRPYACTQCTKSFRTKGCLVQHMLVHGDEYKYTCQYCGKKSKKLTTHVNHVNIHTDTKPYKCPDCDRPFRQLSDMKKHRKTHLKYKSESITITELPFMSIKTEVEDMIAAESIQQLQLA